MKRAFTLIELLVVIAIIAILAAILFPVFAQAKKSAKGAVTLSNTKQITLATIMYGSDSDDTFVPYMYWGDITTAACYFGGDLYTPWTILLVPYMKNTDLYTDPLEQPPSAVPAGWPANSWKSIVPEFGYNYTTLAPVWSGTGSSGPSSYWYSQPYTMTSVGRPADVVLHSATSWKEWWWWYGGYTMVSVGMQDAPDCNDIPQWCFQNWGVGGNITNITGGSDVEGSETGFATLQLANQATFSFVDGHSKRLTPASGAQGTNFYMEMPSGNLVINNPSIYRWNLQ